MAEVIDDKQKQPTGTGFTNIQRIIGANEPAQLGQTISSGIGQTIGKSQQELQKQQGQFQQQSQAGAIGGQEDQQYAQQQIANPTADQQAVDRFARFRQGYTGPSQLGNQAQLQSQQLEAQNIAQSVNQPGGQTGLLQRYVGGPSYTQGQQKLDTLLLGQTGGQGIRQGRRSAQDYLQQQAQAQALAQLQGQQLTNQGQQFSQGLQTQIGGAQTGIISGLTDTAAKNTADAAIAQKVLTSALTPGAKADISDVDYQTAQDYLNRTGQGDLLNQNLYGLSNLQGYDVNKIISGNALPETYQQAATQGDVDKYTALAALSGQAPTDLTSTTQIGGYNPLSFLDQGNLQKISQQGKDIYDTAGTQAQQAGEYSNALRQIFNIEKQIGSSATYGSNIFDPNHAAAQQAYNDATKGGQYLQGIGFEGLGVGGSSASLDLGTIANLLNLDKQRQAIAQKEGFDGQTIMHGTGTANQQDELLGGIGSYDRQLAQAQANIKNYTPQTIGDAIKALLAQQGTPTT